MLALGVVAASENEEREDGDHDREETEEIELDFGLEDEKWHLLGFILRSKV